MDFHSQRANRLYHYHFLSTSSFFYWICVPLLSFINILYVLIPVLFNVYSYTSTTLFKLLKVYNTFCIWKGHFPINTVSHIQLIIIFKNFLVILIYFQMFPRLSQSFVMLSKYCWNIYCTCIYHSIWETWHFNSIEFCHPGTWYIISLVITFWNISAKCHTQLWKSHIVFFLTGADPGFVESAANAVLESFFKKNYAKLQIQC